MYQTKQAKGDSGKEPKPWEKPGSVREPVLLWPMNEQCMIMIRAA